jgi:5-methylcytosine-specific restriction endonuclease McrA
MSSVRTLLQGVGQILRGDPSARRNRARGTHCFYCAVRFSEGDLARTVDHRVPRGGGGTDGLVNLVFACRACNQRKKNLPEADFVASEWLARRREEVASGGIGGPGTSG